MPEKKNDWVVAGLNNPGFSNENFAAIADMTTENTQFLSMNDYLKSDFIKNNEVFKDDRGNFSEDKFAQYYAKRASDWAEFADTEYYTGPALDMFSTFRKPDTPVQNIHFDIRRGVNPDRQAIGIEGPNIWSDPVFSQRELAKQNKIYNTEKGEFEDFSVNDHTLVSNVGEWLKDLFKEPLVMAAWDEDGTHVDPITGLQQEHKKGELKLNEKGTYYYETLGGRSILGKDVLSVFDTFTVDGQGLNRYDFFDSNDLHKSVGGTIAKTVASVLPMFCGPAVGYLYAGLQISRGLLESAPMLYGMITAFTDSDTPKWVNDLATFGARTKMSTSDYAKQHVFAFENFGNLVADVAVQWGQQRLIAEALGRLRGTQRIVKNAQRQADALFEARKSEFVGREALLQKVCYDRFVTPAQKLAQEASGLGRDMSLVYMAIISNTDVYEDMLERGSSKFDAAAVAFGSSLGMFWIDKYAHLGELFFDDATSDTVKQARAALRKEFQGAHKAIEGIAKSEQSQQSKLVSLIKKGIDGSKRVFGNYGEALKYHTTGFFGKALGEGLEEVGEEVMADMSKSLYQVAGQFGLKTSIEDAGAWDNAFERYAMNFLGGAVGGSVFYGKDLWDGKSFHRAKLDEDIATLIRNGHADDLREQLDRMTKEGHTGSKTLSGINPVKGDDGTLSFLTTANERETQSAIVSNLVRAKINSIEGTLLADRNAMMSDDELFANMVFSEERYLRYQGISDITNLYQDYATTVKYLTDADANYNMALNTVDGTVKGPTFTNDKNEKVLTDEQKKVREENLAKLKKELDDKKAALARFVSGDSAIEYMQKLNFLMDPELHNPFLSIDMNTVFAKYHPGKKMEDLTDEERLKFQFVEYPAYVQEQLKPQFPAAWAAFKELEETVRPHMSALSVNAPEYKKWAENIKTLFDKDGPLNLQKLIDSHKTFNDKLDTETDEEYANRDKKMISKATGVEETQDEYTERYNNRIRALDAYNDAQDQAFADRIRAELAKVNMRVDPQTARYIMSIISGRGVFEQAGTNAAGETTTERRYSPGQWGRQRVVINRKIEMMPFGESTPRLQSELRQLNSDLSNADQIVDIERTRERDIVAKSFEDKINPLFQLTLKYKAKGSAPISLADFIATLSEADIPEIADWTIQNFFDSFAKYRSGIRDESVQFWVDADFTEESLNDIHNAFAKLSAYQADLDGLYSANFFNLASGHLDMEYVTESINRLADSASKEAVNAMLSVIEDIRNNPLFKLQSELEANIVNPVAEFIKHVAEANGDKLPDIENLLSKIQSDYANIQDVTELVLDDTTKQTLEKAMHYMQLMKCYFYAAASVPNTEIPIGHNKIINAYAKIHQDQLSKPWENLPELDSDYATLFEQTLDDYCDEIQGWIELSNANRANQLAKFRATDKVFNTVMYEVLKGMPHTIKVNNKEYDLFAGDGDIDEQYLDSDYAQVPLFHLECRLHDNVANIAKEQGMTVEELVRDHGLLQAMLPTISGMKDQDCTEITASMKPEDVTTYTKFVYLATVLSEDPRVYYKQLINRIAEDDQLIPNVPQEYGARVAQASSSALFNSIAEYVHKLTRPNQPYIPNLTFITGVAGAGKTRADAGFVNYVIKDKPALVSAPTLDQAKVIRDALGRNVCGDKEELLENVLGKDQWNDIKNELKKINDPDGEKTFDTKYFLLTTDNEGNRILTFKPESVTFRALAEKPAALFFDEATHLSSLEAQILGHFCKSLGIQMYALGDTSQNGFLDKTNLVTNIDEASVWCVRTPKLTVSMRVNNVQKSMNDGNVYSLLRELDKARLKLNSDDYSALAPQMRNKIAKLNLRVYTKDDINGDLITENLSDDILKKLKALYDAKKSIAFIGPKSSTYLTALRAAGINLPDENVLTMENMQSQEFDYVVVDHIFSTTSSIQGIHSFMKDLYTLMTRAKSGSIFIDKGNRITDAIGRNVVSDIKATAPTIDAKTRNEIREQKKKVLKLLMPEDTAATPANSTDNTNNPQNPQNPQNPAAPANPSTPGTQGTPTVNTPAPANTPAQNAPKKDQPTDASNGGMNSTDPEKKRQDPLDKTLIDRAKSYALEDEKKYDSGLPLDVDAIDDVNDLLTFPIEGYSDFTTLSVEESDDTVKNKKRKTGTHAVKRWTVRVPQTGVLRNLQALANDGEYAVSWQEKIKLQNRIDDVKSVLTFGETWNELPADIQNRFNKTDWDNGKFKLEIREATDSDIAPVFSPMTTTDPTTREKTTTVGMVYNGKRIIASVVFDVVNKEGRVCRFDLAALNNPDVLLNNVPTIKSNLNKKIDKLKTSSKESDKVNLPKLQDMYRSVESTARSYKKWFSDRVGEMKDGVFTMDLLGDDFSLSKTTWLRRRDTPVRLGGRVNPNNITENDVQDLIDLNPKMVFSEVYTFTGQQYEDYVVVDQSLKGKAVVFVTAKRSLGRTTNPDELLERYIEQKVNPKDHDPEVRMIVLGNYGMSFSDMCNSDYLATLQGTTHEPFKQNFNGARMFASLWNARAALTRFNNALHEWEAQTFGVPNDDSLARNTTVQEKLKWLLEAEYMRYQNPDVDLTTFFNQHGLTQDMLDSLKDFNNRICNERGIIMFRLGHNVNGNGFHIQQFGTTWTDADGTVRYNSSYGTAADPVTQANLLAITPEMAEKFDTMLNVVFDGILVSDSMTKASERFTVGASWTDRDGKVIKFPPKEDYIKCDGSTIQKGLSNHIKKNLGNIQFLIPGLTGFNVVYGNSDGWSAIPLALKSVVRVVEHFQMHPDEVMNDKYTYAKVQYGAQQDANGDWTEKEAQIQLSPLIGSQAILKSITVTDENGNQKTVPDYSLRYMLDLIFHGTIEDFQNGSPMQLTDAYFKNGFFINPDVVREKGSDGRKRVAGHLLGVGAGGQDTMDFYRIGTVKALFTCDVDVRAAGIRLNLNMLMRPADKRAQAMKKVGVDTSASTADQIEAFRHQYPDEFAVMQVMQSMGKPVTFTYAGMMKAMESYNSSQKEAFWLDMIDGNLDDAQILQWYIANSDANKRGMMTTVAGAILEENGVMNAELYVDNGKLYARTPEGSIYVFDVDSESLVIVSSAEVPTMSNPAAQSTSRLDDIYMASGETLYDTFISTINSLPGMEEMNGPLLMRDLKEIYDSRDSLSVSELNTTLSYIKNDESYDGLFEALLAQNGGEDLYNNFFKGC